MEGSQKLETYQHICGECCLSFVEFEPHFDWVCFRCHTKLKIEKIETQRTPFLKTENESG